MIVPYRSFLFMFMRSVRLCLVRGYDFQMVSKGFSSVFRNCEHLTRLFFQFHHKRNLYSRINELKVENDSNSSKTIKGWVKSVRKLKNVVFLDVNDGSSNTSLQVVVNKNDLINSVTCGSSIIVSGDLNLNPHNNLELVAKSLEIIGECNVEKFPFRPKKNYTNEYIREHLHYRFRTNRFSSLIRVRHHAYYSLHDYFIKNGYLNINTPILTSNDCEGAGEVFNVVSDNETILKSSEVSKLKKEKSFFDDKAYLTVSGQLHLEAAAHGMGNVYTFGPAFRAENSQTRFHLSEFFMAEAESSFTSTIEDVTSICEKLIKHMTKMVLDKADEEVYSCRKLFLESENLKIEPLENIITSNFVMMSYNEAADIILKNKDQFKSRFNLNDGFSKEHEIFLVQYNSSKPIFIVNWPSVLKPFYMKKINDDNVAAFDLLFPNIGELCGGSLREDDFNKLEIALTNSKLNDKLKWYLDLRKYGSVPTGGFGLGFERYLQVLLNINNIKDTIPFPRWPHNCKM